MHKMLKPTLITVAVVVATLYLIVFLQQATKDVSQDIISLDGITIAPSETSKKPVPKFSSINDVTEKKQAFFNYLLPEIKRQNAIVLKEREIVLALQTMHLQGQTFNKQQQKVLDKLTQKYHLSNDTPLPLTQNLERLVRRVDIIPEALILVQAANESGWGSSRFAQQGYNFFGLWCFKKGCGFVPKSRNEDAEHEVAKFRDLSHAVMTYIRNLNRHYAYKELRDIRVQLRANNQPITARALAQGLSSYSERGQDYIDELLSMLRVNRKHMDLDN
ncbi:glucosaminidase domain-containing protein [Paraglaciecola aestuariivivens]